MYAGKQARSRKFDWHFFYLWPNRPGRTESKSIGFRPVALLNSGARFAYNIVMPEAIRNNHG